MSKIGYGYGSEWHLLRYLGYHRNNLNSELQKIKVFRNKEIEWLDFKFSGKNIILQQDEEYKGVEFLNNTYLSKKFATYWPSKGNVQNWDAVGIIKNDQGNEWILVEAKANIPEIESDCGASSQNSLNMIDNAFLKTISFLNINSKTPLNWRKNYYQFCNRLALLKFLLDEGIDAYLLFIYFYGDTNPNHKCPQIKQDWDNELNKMYNHVGINQANINPIYFEKVHKLYLSVF